MESNNIKARIYSTKYGIISIIKNKDGVTINLFDDEGWIPIIEINGNFNLNNNKEVLKLFKDYLS